MTREQRLVAVAALRAEGRTVKAIAERLGVHQSHINRDLALLNARERTKAS